MGISIITTLQILVLPSIVFSAFYCLAMSFASVQKIKAAEQHFSENFNKSQLAPVFLHVMKKFEAQEIKASEVSKTSKETMCHYIARHLDAEVLPADSVIKDWIEQQGADDDDSAQARVIVIAVISARFFPSVRTLSLLFWRTGSSPCPHVYSHRGSCFHGAYVQGDNNEDDEDDDEGNEGDDDQADVDVKPVKGKRKKKSSSSSKAKKHKIAEPDSDIFDDSDADMDAGSASKGKPSRGAEESRDSSSAGVFFPPFSFHGRYSLVDYGFAFGSFGYCLLSSTFALICCSLRCFVVWVLPHRYVSGSLSAASVRYQACHSTASFIRPCGPC